MERVNAQPTQNLRYTLRSQCFFSGLFGTFTNMGVGGLGRVVLICNMCPDILMKCSFSAYSHVRLTLVANDWDGFQKSVIQN